MQNAASFIDGNAIEVGQRGESSIAAQVEPLPLDRNDVECPESLLSADGSSDISAVQTVVDSETQTQLETLLQATGSTEAALAFACETGQEKLVWLLLTRGDETGPKLQHRDKNGFTPLHLAATAGRITIVNLLLNHDADIEAQCTRRKNTALSLACSGGQYNVVESLLNRGANKEHRNVSDNTPLCLAANEGHIDIMKVLLNHGAEINSCIESKLSITPLMLAALNGHTEAVKLLLDEGCDIHAVIIINRNTALTLACYQGRSEVASLLISRNANIEHRATTGLTPLMEAATGGYVEVGQVLLDNGAYVNAPPVPSTDDTALTIAVEKGHCDFVKLLLSKGAHVDVKTKDGNSPMSIAKNGGHLDIVELLLNVGADIDR